MAFGDYPKEYNPSVHGPYDPARYYGKPDTPFGQVKINELAGWLARRSKTPQAVAGACSRAWWRWQHKYVQPKRVGMAPFFQLLVGSMTFFYVINYGKMSIGYSSTDGRGNCGILIVLFAFVFIEAHRNYKYH